MEHGIGWKTLWVLSIHGLTNVSFSWSGRYCAASRKLFVAWLVCVVRGLNELASMFSYGLCVRKWIQTEVDLKGLVPSPYQCLCRQDSNVNFEG